MRQIRTYSSLPSYLKLCVFYVLCLTCTPHAIKQDQQKYIVYMGHSKGKAQPNVHSSFLKRALGNNSSASVVYSYKGNINGFVALLTAAESKRISSKEEEVIVFPSRNHRTLTTKSWDFIRFPRNIYRSNAIENNIVVGILDTGIWPELDAFSDRGFRTTPTKWRGSCSGLRDFSCNMKIIGARYYKNSGHFRRGDIRSPRDTDGHGTHVASTIAGNLVPSSGFYGFGGGIARGGVPSSRIAVYKVCWSSGCADEDIFEAFSDAIKDGVDIISISIGNPTTNYDTDPIAFMSFRAMNKGIITSMAAGNEGPERATIKNVAPWALTTAASTIDRTFITNLILNNGATLNGISVNTFDPNGYSTLVYDASSDASRKCKKNSLNARLVRGKIVICDKDNLGEAALSAGAVGMVIRAHGAKDDADVFALPATYLDLRHRNDILHYMNSSRTIYARILKSHQVSDNSAPYTASFSSIGPSHINPHILKPDLSAPGVKIMAAWTLVNSPTGVDGDQRRQPYNILSGTSMACAHASAVSAYVKSFYPSWSPSAIKSALITTASRMSEEKTPLAELAYGAGQINPIRALNPGLVYDAQLSDYVKFLCGQGYNNKKLKFLTGERNACDRYGRETAWNLNMPSFAIPVLPSTHFNVQYSRTVTNVGASSSTYTAHILAPPGLNVQVIPNTLHFSSVRQSQSFTVVFKGIVNRGNVVSGSLSWVSSPYTVRSPIVAFAVR